MKIGDRIPVITALNHEGSATRIHPDELDKPVVIYFYPKDDTPGCIKEACAFRDYYEAFTDAGVQVFGVSADSVESHRHFKSKYNLPFTLLSDPDKSIRRQFKVPSNLLGLIPGRVTYVIDRTGKVVHCFNSQLKAEEHVTESLKALNKL